MTGRQVNPQCIIDAISMQRDRAMSGEIQACVERDDAREQIVALTAELEAAKKPLPKAAKKKASQS